MLYERSTVEQATFTRGQIESDENNLEVSATVFDLLKVFQKIMERRKEEIQDGNRPRRNVARRYDQKY